MSLQGNNTNDVHSVLIIIGLLFVLNLVEILLYYPLKSVDEKLLIKTRVLPLGNRELFKSLLFILESFQQEKGIGNSQLNIKLELLYPIVVESINDHEQFLQNNTKIKDISGTLLALLNLLQRTVSLQTNLLMLLDISHQQQIRILVMILLLNQFINKQEMIIEFLSRLKFDAVLQQSLKGVLLERFGYIVDKGHRHYQQYESSLKILTLNDFQQKQHSASPKVHKTENLKDVPDCSIIKRILVYIEVCNGYRSYLCQYHQNPLLIFLEETIHKLKDDLIDYISDISSGIRPGQFVLGSNP